MVSGQSGTAKALIDTESDRILGFAMFGAGAGEAMVTVQMTMLVHRLICSWHMVAFKMGRRQGARRAHI
jgi:pyruvate/2-oxoglutarate dehydrogenase complex dihydrolipoamide dehydrogenase (E3) component